MSQAPVDLWVYHFSCQPLLSADDWAAYFEEAQRILGASISHFDENDPVRRRVKPGDSRALGEYAIAFGEHESSRQVFGRMASIGLEFDTNLHRETRVWPNSVTWYFRNPATTDCSLADKVRALFRLGNRRLESFYAFADLQPVMSAKGKASGRSVDLFAELLGVFWLTYFGPHYVKFIGRDRLAQLEGVQGYFDEGATLSLGETVSDVPADLRRQVEALLRPRLFVDPADHTDKRPGQFALSAEQLSQPL
ncbi:MAG: hypothetical protein U0836_11935 [Pirellulales bacterium]